MNKKECKWYFVCPMKYFLNRENCIRFQKEENGIYHPDNMLPNGEIGENLS